MEFNGQRILSPQQAEQLCCPTCNKAMNRSFCACPQCQRRWDPGDVTSVRYYCNTAWRMCQACSEAQQRCIMCGNKR